MHGILYDHSQITEQHIVNRGSNIPVRCTICNHTWSPTITHHITHGTGCPRCKRSKGELNCQSVLDEMGISYDIEYSIPSLPKKYFDFRFMYNNKWYILEYDGIQHFKQIAFFHSDEDKFKYNQSKDVIKSFHAVNTGYYLIRIDYTQLRYIKSHIMDALLLLNDDIKIYYSNINMYYYIHENLSNFLYTGYLTL